MALLVSAVFFFLTCISFLKCGSCVSEQRFNDFQEVVLQQIVDLKTENIKLKQKLQHFESKLEHYVDREKEYAANKVPGVVANLAYDKPGDDDINTRGIQTTDDTIDLSGKWKRQQSENVAFYAYISGSRCYGMHETFVFDVEETDVSKNYNDQDGLFDAPFTGVYVFAVTLVPDYHKYVQAEIIINGFVKGRVFADSEEINDIHPSSSSIVVQVNAGDHVYVRRGNHSTCNVISDTSHARTTFSGWLLP